MSDHVQLERTKRKLHKARLQRDMWREKYENLAGAMQSRNSEYLRDMLNRAREEAMHASTKLRSMSETIELAKAIVRRENDAE